MDGTDRCAGSVVGKVTPRFFGPLSVIFATGIVALVADDDTFYIQSLPGTQCGMVPYHGEYLPYLRSRESSHRS
eukprot:scaffold34606_cov192-Amphora_coffeaeformis.AAC.7